MKLLLCSLALVATSLFGQTASSSPATPAIQVMVLGTYHFANPGHDLHNVQVDSVLVPAKQAELAEVATRLAKFNPTKIAVEATSDEPDFAYKKFNEFRPEMLTSNANERVQIGFRLAQMLKQKTVYGIDEQSETIDYFPYDKVDAFAKARGKGERLERMQKQIGDKVSAMQTAQKTTPVRLMLANLNEPASILEEQRGFYYGIMDFARQGEQPGADLNAAWYHRNARIFAKLTQIAQPGDRVLVVYGSGHCFWLRHFVENTPGYQLVEPRDYLR